MRKAFVLLLIAVVGLSLATQAEARRGCRTTTVAAAEENHNVAGVKIDAPNLVKLDKEGKWTLGAEGGKDIIKNIFHNDNAYYEADKGYFAYLKVTYKGCLLNCKEGE